MPDATLETLIQIAQEAAAVVMQVYERPFAVDYKGPADPVTEADRQANTLICARLREAFPDAAVVAEESPEHHFAHYRESERVFFVDPVDGTREFVARNGEFVVMIGLLQGDDPTHGVIHAPALGTFWAGAVGSGAFEGRVDGSRSPLRIEGCTEISAARVVASRSRRGPNFESALRHLAAREFVPMGSAGLKGVAIARGLADVYLAADGAGYRWDACAPDAIVPAAGGRFTDVHGVKIDYRAEQLRNDRGVIAANLDLHPKVVERMATLPR